MCDGGLTMDKKEVKFAVKLTTVDDVIHFSMMLAQSEAAFELSSGRNKIDNESLSDIFCLDLSKTLSLKLYETGCNMTNVINEMRAYVLS